MTEHFRMMARYNAWANTRLGAAAAELSDEEFFADRGAFFGSIRGTLDHILLVDRLWRGRITGDLYPIEGLDDRVSADRQDYLKLRAEEDETLIELAGGFSATDLVADVTYTTTTGDVGTSPLNQLLMHMFNHATHHRGQVHGLLSQVPADPPPLDLIYYLRDY